MTASPCSLPLKTGFTLVELLVVLAIIAVLAALLLPVFSNARRKAWQTTCGSNQRQIGMGLALYLQDFDETYPNYGFEPDGTQAAGDLEKHSWRTVLTPYLRAVAVMACPANPDSRSPSWDPRFPISYAVNQAWNPREYPVIPRDRKAISSGLFGQELSPGVKAASVLRPAECIGVVESAHIPDSFFVVDIANDYRWSGPNGEVSRVYEDCLFTGHSGVSNYLFADGHVRAIKPTATYRGNEVNYWYRDATPLGAEARTTLAEAESHNN